jgi:hypothetical protein
MSSVVRDLIDRPATSAFVVICLVLVLGWSAWLAIATRAFVRARGRIRQSMRTRLERVASYLWALSAVSFVWLTGFLVQGRFALRLSWFAGTLSALCLAMAVALFVRTRAKRGG